MAQQHDVKGRWQVMIQKVLQLDRKRILQQHKEDFQPLGIGKVEHRTSKENLQPSGLTKDEPQISREKNQLTSSVKDDRQTSDEARPEDRPQAETNNSHDRSHQSTKPILMLHQSSYRVSQVTSQLGMFMERCEKEKPKMDEKLFHIKELMMELGERLVDLDTECLELE